MAYTTIDDPSAHFQMAFYTGDGNDDRAITNDGNSDLQPDLIWFKNRSTTNSHNVLDSTRGVTKRLRPDDDSAEATVSTRLKSFDSDGMTISTDPSVNGDGNSIVAWQWKANGGTRTTNTESGNNPGGGYQANTTAGFSIVDYTGTGAAGTMAHGLGAAPHMIIIKTRATGNFNVYHKSITAHKYLLLSTNAAETDTTTRFNDAEPTSSVFTVNTAADVNEDGTNYIAYAFAPIQGYSKFSKYKGNGNANGPFVYTGFKPAWVMVKKSSDSHDWYIQYGETGIDNADQGFNPIKYSLIASSTSVDASENSMDFCSNGFKIRTAGNGHNTNGSTYVYMAFAEHPFVSSKGVPCTAR